MHAKAERMTQQINAQREVLGQEKFERYQALQSCLGRRHQVREFHELFGEADKLSGAQRERLVELLHEQLTKSIEQSRPLHFQRATLARVLSDMPSPEELQRTSQLQAIMVNEQTWRESPESNRELRKRAAEFLT